MLIDRKNLAKQRVWIVIAGATAIGATVWYCLASRGLAEWPGGGSPPGLTFGIVGGLLILFEFALWGRKKVRSWRVGRVQTWMAAHLWLGLLTVPLLVYHSGFRWGGSLSTVLMVLFLAVIASGVWGLAMQQVLPRLMLLEVPAETIHSQIPRLARLMVDDARRLVNATCGTLPGEETRELEPREVEEGASASYLTIGAVQRVGSVQGKVLTTLVPREAVPNSEPLREIFRTSVVPYLIEGKKSGSRLAIATKAAGIFRDLRIKIDQSAHETIDHLENYCDQRRQLDRQQRLHFWLHGWLAFHLPLSIALVVLMFVHVWVALKYR